MENINTCPVCDSANLENFLEVKDHSISKENFKLQKCHTCDLIFTNPRPDKETIGRYYKSEEYISHSDTKTGIVNTLYHKVRSITLKGKVAIINFLKKDKGNILDIGCGTGYFLQACKQDGWTISGTEPDKKARETAEKITGISIKENPEQLIEKSFKADIITLWHVLEHVHDLKETMQIVSKLLDKKGYLIIALPNPDSYDARKYQSFWAAYDVPRHLYHFKKNTVKTLLEKNDFILKEIKPMKFDSFYVSMLSEKYKRGNSSLPSLVKAFATGIKSNVKASANKNYSSLIYIAEKKE